MHGSLGNPTCFECKVRSDCHASNIPSSFVNPCSYLRAFWSSSCRVEKCLVQALQENSQHAQGEWEQERDLGLLKDDHKCVYKHGQDYPVVGRARCTILIYQSLVKIWIYILDIFFNNNLLATFTSLSHKQQLMALLICITVLLFYWTLWADKEYLHWLLDLGFLFLSILFSIYSIICMCSFLNGIRNECTVHTHCVSPTHAVCVALSGQL